jgi:hypothetical protein
MNFVFVGSSLDAVAVTDDDLHRFTNANKLIGDIGTEDSEVRYPYKRLYGPIMMVSCPPCCVLQRPKQEAPNRKTRVATPQTGKPSPP